MGSAPRPIKLKGFVPHSSGPLNNTLDLRMPGCGWGGCNANPITAQSDSTSHAVWAVVSTSVQRSSVWKWSAAMISRSWGFDLHQLFKLTVCQLQSTRLRAAPHLNTITLTSESAPCWRPSVSACSCPSSIEMSVIIAFTCEITTNTTVFTARFVKLKGIWVTALKTRPGSS